MFVSKFLDFPTSLVKWKSIKEASRIVEGVSDMSITHNA